jgi:DNA mismatch endonuclease (patch repair protein)
MRPDSRGVSFASSPEIRARMQRQARKDTAAEVGLRRALHRRGLRYRLQVRLLPRRTCDIVFSRARVVVDVRSCFWHRCPIHHSMPKSNPEWWEAKLSRTVARDAETTTRLAELGWTVVVVWEHDDHDDAADRIAALVRSQPVRSPPDDPERPGE